MERSLLKDNGRFLGALLRLVDGCAITAACFVSYGIIFKHVGMLPSSCIYLWLISILFSILFFPYYGLYKTWRGISLLKEINLYIYAVVSLFLFLVLVLFLLKTGEYFSRVWVISWFACIIIIGISARITVRVILRRLRAQGFNLKRIVIMGGRSSAVNVIAKIQNAPWTGLHITGYFGAEPSAGGNGSLGAPWLGAIEHLQAFLAANRVDQVWIALPMAESDKIKSIVNALRHYSVDIRFVPDIYGFDLLNHSLTEIAGLPVVDLSVTPANVDYKIIKDIEDKLLAALFLVMASPLMLLIAAGIKLSSSGPVFYRQERVTMSGRTFMMLKFRTMAMDIEKKTGAVWARPFDNRATGLGYFLRRTSLDELPQFLNVLKGEMSIVGPRPERPVFVEEFKDQVPGYMKKHMVKAGITGWAQVNGWRGDTSLEKRIEHDLYYIANWSLLFDLKIMVLTLFKGFFNQNAY